MASRRAVPLAEPLDFLGLRARNESGPVNDGLEANPGARSKAEASGRPWVVRSRHALFRLKDQARPVAGLCLRRPSETCRLSRRPHVLFARRLAPGVPG